MNSKSACGYPGWKRLLFFCCNGCAMGVFLTAFRSVGRWHSNCFAGYLTYNAVFLPKCQQTKYKNRRNVTGAVSFWCFSGVSLGMVLTRQELQTGSLWVVRKSGDLPKPILMDFVVVLNCHGRYYADEAPRPAPQYLQALLFPIMSCLLILDIHVGHSISGGIGIFTGVYFNYHLHSDKRNWLYSAG